MSIREAEVHVFWKSVAGIAISTISLIQLTYAIRGEPEPVAENAPALVARVEGEEAVEAVLLLASAAFSTHHLLLREPGNKLHHFILKLTPNYINYMFLIGFTVH